MNFVFSNFITLRPGWFAIKAIIKQITFRDVGKIVEIEPGAFDDCTFRSVSKMELRGTAIKVLQDRALNGLNNLKSLSLYGNTHMTAIEENALDPLYQLEEFIMEDHKQLSDLNNVTGKIHWKYLHSLILTKNSFRSTIKKPTFKGCNGVKILNLSHSGIDTIGPESFDPMDKTIEVLDLSYNTLKHLPSGLLANMIRPNLQLYLGNNLWDCNCAAAELQEYELNNYRLICDAPLICETPSWQKENQMRNVSLIECFETTSSTDETLPSTSAFATTTPVTLEYLRCSNGTSSIPHFIALDTEYQFFNIKQEELGRVSIQIHSPDSSLAMVVINDHDYAARCEYDLKKTIFFDSLNPVAGHLFCLIKKTSYATSPRNCLPFHFFNGTNMVWSRGKIVITVVCSLALAIVLGAIIGWLLICRYRRVFKSKNILRCDSSRNSINSKIISAELNHKGSFFMDNNRTNITLRY